MRNRYSRRRPSPVVAVVFAVFTLFGAITSCSSDPPQTATTTLVAPIESAKSTSGQLQEIRQRGTVRIGVKYDVPLFGLRDPSTGNLSGFDIEIARAVAQAIFPDVALDKVDGRISFTEALSKNRELMISSGTVDLVISTYTINDARKQLVDFAGPYYIAGQDILAPRTEIESGRIRGVADVNGKRVCAVRGSTSLTNLIAEAPKAITTITRDKYSECFQDLKDGRVEAMTTDDAILLGLTKDFPEFAVTGNPFHTEPYGIGIPKGDDELRTFVNDALETMISDGSWIAAFNRTIGETGAVAPTPPRLDRYE